jgi:hypothetical protein
MVIVAVSSIMLVGSISTQLAEAGSDANCPAKRCAATTIDSNTPNTVNTVTTTVITTNSLRNHACYFIFLG